MRRGARTAVADVVATDRAVTRIWQAGLSALALAAGLALATPSRAEVDTGSYLAARHAGLNSDYRMAAMHYAQSLASDPTNTSLMENALVSFLGLGELRPAAPLAERMLENGADTLFARMTAHADAAAQGEFGEILRLLEAGHQVSPLVDGLLRAWAYVGLGEMSRALSAFDEVIEQPQLRPFGIYHKAAALSMVGDLEGANALLSTSAADSLLRTRRATILQAQILAALGQTEAAVARIEQVFGPDPEPTFAAIRHRILAGEPAPFDQIGTAQEGVAEIFYSVASSVANERTDGVTLIYARLAQALAPDSADPAILSGAVLAELEQYSLAASAYAVVGPTNPAYHAAELGRAEVLRKGGRQELAEEVLDHLTRSYPESATAFASLGDVQRRLENHEGAIAAYTRALALYPSDYQRRWFIHFTRGISYYQLDNWPGAEADFRAALETRPDQPQVLNFLGYSLVERRENLDEALEMISRAVAGQPDNGAIVDSLGWALYRLGQYDEAVGHMERAAELKPVDPIINDHLGDVYWAVGRYREAQFQWTRALSFDPEPEEAERIRRKLAVGLDIVLQEEGAEPLAVAQGG